MAPGARAGGRFLVVAADAALASRPSGRMLNRAFAVGSNKVEHSRGITSDREHTDPYAMRSVPLAKNARVREQTDVAAPASLRPTSAWDVQFNCWHLGHNRFVSDSPAGFTSRPPAGFPLSETLHVSRRHPVRLPDIRLVPIVVLACLSDRSRRPRSRKRSFLSWLQTPLSWVQTLLSWLQTLLSWLRKVGPELRASCIDWQPLASVD
ncbi:hypothetical protein BD626DRAFT_536855 [Schizophyllum amplum]|uniref:Uncharacterized protein n=1 Tax=Schizophyllum amplum TaxID=97359 RepID=A0A550CF78_9AGAR|nr:hypothetical protein BD626DRAFT_536855 [Auriculariopsis ampla]